MNSKNIIYTLATSLSFALCSCTSEEVSGTFDRTADDVIDFTAGLQSSVVQHSMTRAGQENALSSDTKIRLKVDGKWSSTDISKTALCSLNGSAVVYDENNTLYWDDYGIGDPANKTNTDTGLSVLGVALDSLNTPPTPSDWTKMEWKTTDDNGQTEVSSSKLIKDILISNNLSTSKYTFANRNVATAKNLLFVHPLSKITFNITAGTGFASGFKSDPVLKLVDKNGNPYAFATGTIKISGGVATKGNTASVVIAGTTSESNDKKNYIKQVLVYPGTPLGAASTDVIAVLSADGNDYHIKAAEIQAAMNDKGQTDHTTVANYNYVIGVTVNKTNINLTASVTNWDDISANGKAEINFNANVTSSTTDNTNTTSLKAGDKFTLWRSTDGTTYGDATTCTYNSETITSDPVRYWEDGSGYYFRALAKYSGTTVVIADSETDVKQQTDLLWGTTAAHEGKEANNTTHTYNKGALINPRTSDVPLAFEHAMSQVSFTMESKTGDSNVDLTDATFTLGNLAKTGTIDITDGEIKPSTMLENVFADATSGASDIMIPQPLGNDVILKVTLKDGTTYSQQLNKCTVSGKTTAITEWARGNKYDYKITITKEAVQFRVMVENWKPTTGSGNATLDWD